MTSLLEMMSPQSEGYSLLSPPSFSTNGDNDGKDDNGGFVGKVPNIQFSTSHYYCRDCEPVVSLWVMRVGSLNGRSSVIYQTKDGSAVAGMAYGAQSGQLDFAPGEHAQEIQIRIGEYNDEFWNPTLEFSVALLEEGLIGGRLDENLYQASVRKIDTSEFPSDAARDENASNLRILIKFNKMLWKMPKVRNRTLWVMKVDVVHNLWYLVNLFLNVFFINFIIAVDKDIPLIGDRRVALGLYVSILVMSMLVLHRLDYSKLHSGIGGTGRSFLQIAVAEKYLSATALARSRVSRGDILAACQRDAPVLISDGYVGILKMQKAAGQFLAMVLFKLLSPVVFGHKTDLSMLIPLGLFPVVVIVFAKIRESTIVATLKHDHLADNAVDDAVEFVAENIEIVKDYDRRDLAKTFLQDKIEIFNAAAKESAEYLLNTEYFTQWLSCILTASYIFVGGLSVISGSESVGVLITNIHILKDCGNMCNNMFETFIKIQKSLPSMMNIFEVLNLDSEDEEKLELERPSSIPLRLQKPPADNSIIEDTMPIVIDLYEGFTFPSRDGSRSQAILNFAGKLELKQGQMIGFVGDGGCGKATYLRMIGGTLLPDTAKLGDTLGIHIPCHLRRVTVSSHPVVYNGTLYDNITFGCSRDDWELDYLARVRVVEILQRLHVSDNVVSKLDSVSKWGEIFSEAECKLVNIARALFFNAEILCLHKPLMKLDSVQMPIVMDALRVHIDNKGFAMPADDENFRRPRTIFVSSTNPEAIAHFDSIFRVSPREGVSAVPIEAAALEDRPAVREDIEAADLVNIENITAIE